MKGTMEILKWMWNKLKEWWLPIALFLILFYFRTDIVVDFPKWLISKYYTIFPAHQQSDSQVQHPGTINLDPSTTGPIGDTFGGTLGPLIAIIAAYLTFLAFWIQYKANQQQKSDLQIERFESKFYEMLRLHKENLHEIVIGGYEARKVVNRKAFVSMYKELRFAFVITKDIYDRFRKNKLTGTEYTDEELLKIAYIFFYAGVGVHSDIINSEMRPKEFDETLFNAIRIRIRFFHQFHKKLKEKPDTYPVISHPDVGEARLPKSFRPFGGHMSQLGHYYRHLFQTVKYVVQQNEELIGKGKKLEYLRTLRAQLSDHEQVMLYYNALSKFGEEWIIENYFTEYRMIHNLPLPLASFGAKPEDKFKDYIDEHGDIFEWNGA